MAIDKKSALIIVDLQYDFLPGGSLAVEEGDAVVPVLNEYIQHFDAVGAPIYATRDWHPEDHISFEAQGGIWPPHCVQGSKGAAFHHELALPDDVTIISKGDDPNQEAYSGFQGTDLVEQLRAQGIERIYVGGLATDYCVKNTVLDGLKAGFDTFLLTDAARGVEVNEGDVEQAEEEMEAAGARPTTLDSLATHDDAHPS